MNPRLTCRVGMPLLLVGAAVALLPVLLDAVLVAPHAVFLSDSAPSGVVQLFNQSADPEEVTLELKFGYPATDSTGEAFITWPESDSDHRSAAGWLRAFPRRVLVEPGQRQIVRLLATPPAGLPVGEYWSRMIVTARTVQPANAVTGDTGARAGVILVLRTVTSVTYRNGQVRTGVRLDDLRVTTEGDTLVAWVALTREGNAAYLGLVSFEVRDTANRIFAEWTTPIAVYYSVNQRFAFPIDTLPAGFYSVHFRLSTDREDIPAEDILPADPIERSVGVEVK